MTACRSPSISLFHFLPYLKRSRMTEKPCGCPNVNMAGSGGRDVTICLPGRHPGQGRTGRVTLLAQRAGRNTLMWTVQTCSRMVEGSAGEKRRELHDAEPCQCPVRSPSLLPAGPNFILVACLKTLSTLRMSQPYHSLSHSLQSQGTSPFPTINACRSCAICLEYLIQRQI